MSYISRQFDKLSGRDMRLQVISSSGETHWLEVTPKEVHAIERILRVRETEAAEALIDLMGL